MKKTFFVCLSVLFIGGFRIMPVYAAWTIENKGGGNYTISEGEWTLTCSLSGKELNVRSVSTNPEGDSLSLDLSTPVNNGDYTIGTINAYMFSQWTGKTKLASIKLPSTLHTIGQSAFNGCTGLTTVEPFLPDSVTSIGQRAFEGCSSLTGDLKILADNVTFGGGFVFQSTSITSAELGSGVTSIGQQMFYGCKSLERVILNGQLEKIDQRAFQNCTALTIVEPFLPDSVVSIGQYAFNGCTSLKGDLKIGMKGNFVDFGSSTTSHFGDTAIETVELGAGVTGIPNNGFSYCSSLTNVIFRGKIETISANAFDRAAKFLNIWFSNEPPTSFGAAWCRSYNVQPDILFHVPKNSEAWKTFFSDQTSKNQWEDLAETRQTQYWTYFPNEKKNPLGYFSGWNNNSIWMTEWNPNAGKSGFMLIVR